LIEWANAIVVAHHLVLGSLISLCALGRVQNNKELAHVCYNEKGSLSLTCFMQVNAWTLHNALCISF